MSLPLWGCPWHGLVRGGVLTLPNGQTMTFPQPATHMTGTTAITDTAGSAHLLKVPGVPEVERSTEEQAADDAAGRQWRNSAVLSGDRQDLYGKSLNGWIYVDPDGARWRVTCSALEENTVYNLTGSWSGTLIFSRFGEFGVAAETHSYPVSCGFGVDGSNPPTSGRVRLESLAPAGSRAILMVHERTMTAQMRRPYAFLEISISGPGGAASVSCSVAKSRTQVSSGTRVAPDSPDYLAGWYQGPPTFVPTWRVQLASAPPGPEEAPFKDAGGRPCGLFSGAISVDARHTLTIWYDTSGNRVDVDYVIAWDGTLDQPAPTASGSSATRTCSGSSNWTISIEVGGAAVSTISGSMTGTSSEVMTQYNPDSYTSDSTVTVDGVDHVFHNSGPKLPLSSWEGAPRDSIYSLLAIGPDDFMPYRVENYATTITGYNEVVRYSPQVIGHVADRESGRAYHPPATPSGVAAGALIVSTAFNRYGAWDPHTGGAVWFEASPVCWV